MRPEAAGGRLRLLIAVISSIGVYGLTSGLSYPLISLNLEARGVNPGLIGLNAAMLALAMLTLSPLVPGLIARLGFRPLVLGALLIEASCFAVLPLSDSLAFWMAMRALMGASATVLFIVAETWLNELADDSSRGRVIGIYVTALSLSFALGPLLIPLTGFTGWLPFLTAAGLLLAAGLPLLFAHSGIRPPAQRAASGLLAFVRGAPLLCGSVLLFAFAEGAALALLPVYGLRLGYDAHQAAALVAVRAAGSVFLQYPIGWLADRYDRRRLLLLSALAGLSGALALPFCSALPVAFWIVLFFWGGLSVGVYTLAMVLLGESFQGRELATGNAAFGIMWGFGSLSGPLVGGAAVSIVGGHGLPLVIAAATAIFLLFARGRRLVR